LEPFTKKIFVLDHLVNCDSSTFLGRCRRNGCTTLHKHPIINNVSPELSNFVHAVVNGTIDYCSNAIHDFNIDGKRKFNNNNNSSDVL
jgi:hypothetical protein